MNDPKREPHLEIIADPDQPTIVTRRSVKAPRALVFDAFTKPELIQRWLGPGALEFVRCEVDLRVGGAWCNVHRAPDGAEFGFRGVFLEIDRPAKIVRTNVFDMMPEHESRETLELFEEGGRTTIVTTSVHATMAGRDGHLADGRMEQGMQAGYARLDALLAALL
ncbi:MAG: SRPBCC family protein [Nannocystaceae bacterium]